MNKVAWGRANYKDWVGVSAAPVFWVASLVCFVLGLSFKSGTGIMIPGTTYDIIVLFSIGLGFANTAIQIVGNDTDKEELGMALWLMWIASYMLGIGSNVNFLYTVIGLNNLLLQFLVCWGLGVMIEVAPERLLVKFLRSVGILKSSQSLPKVTSNPREQYRGSENSIAEFAYKEQTRVQKNVPTNTQRPAPRPQSNFPVQLKEQRREPTYHPVTMRENRGEE